MKFARKVAAFAVTAVALSTVFIGVGVASAATPQSAAAVTTQKCSFPEAEVKEVISDQPETEALLKEKVAAFTPELASCLDLKYTDKCDGTTVPSATNWATNDNQFTVVHLKINGLTKELEGGSSPNSEMWPAVGAPANEALQAWLVFDFELEDGTNIHIEKPFGPLHKWVQPEACPTASPSPSASASPSPSAVPTTGAPVTTTGPTAVPAGNNGDDDDLPLTGQRLFGTIATGAGLIAAGVLALVLIARRRRAASN